MRILVLLAAALLGLAPARAQQYPDRVIKMVVPFVPGSPVDVLARVVSQQMTVRLGQSVVVENRPGAGTSAATKQVQASSPDGYTLLMSGQNITYVGLLYPDIGFDPVKSFTPVATLAGWSHVMLVANNVPAKSVKELVAHAKANPDKSNYGSSSPAFQLTAELFKQRTGAPMQHIPYKGSNESLAAVIANQVLVSFVDAAPAAGQIAAGQVRALAVTAGRRSPQFPDVPTLAEAGVPDMDVTFWSGLFAPAGTPPTIVRKLQDEVRRIVRLPDIQERMQKLAVEPAGNTSEDFSRAIAADIERWTAVARAGNIKIEP
jgi:tripartite-type tricarboxylate transporter receptor subunit TctC